VSFPGGGAEPEDTDLVQTALREAFEEIGVPADRVRVLGKLSELYIPPSNFLVTPVVGYLDFRPDFIADTEEVDHIIEVPLTELLSPNCLTEKEIVIFPDVRLNVPCYYARENIIWGATAMMLSELIETIRTIS
jgi:8-oxo-dGTP pyrophosphatase MutT (NUDIX family)